MSKAFRLKGHCGRLDTIYELPAHQGEPWCGFSAGKWGFAMSKLWLLLVYSALSFAAAHVQAAHADSAVAAVHSVHLAPQSHPPSACTATEGDGLLALTLRHNLCLCVGERSSWEDVVTGAACKWTKQ